MEPSWHKNGVKYREFNPPTITAEHFSNFASHIHSFGRIIPSLVRATLPASESKNLSREIQARAAPQGPDNCAAAAKCSSSHFIQAIRRSPSHTAVFF